MRNLFALGAVDAKAIRAAIIASVVPPLDPTRSDQVVRRYFNIEPLSSSRQKSARCRIAVDNPKRSGRGPHLERRRGAR